MLRRERRHRREPLQRRSGFTMMLLSVYLMVWSAPHGGAICIEL